MVVYDIFNAQILAKRFNPTQYSAEDIEIGDEIVFDVWGHDMTTDSILCIEGVVGPTSQLLKKNAFATELKRKKGRKFVLHNIQNINKCRSFKAEKQRKKRRLSYGKDSDSVIIKKRKITVEVIKELIEETSEDSAVQAPKQKKQKSFRKKKNKLL